MKPATDSITKTVIVFVVLFLLAEILLYLATNHTDNCSNKQNTLYYSHLHNNYGYVNPPPPGGNCDCANETNTNKQLTDNASKLPFGVNLWGYLFADSEIGESTRHYAKSLLAAGVPIVIIDMDKIIPGTTRKTVNTTLSSYLTTNETYPKYYINLFVDEPDMTYQLMEQKLRRHTKNYPVLKDCYNIGVWGWELDVIPPRWNDDYKYYDELWTESTFTSNTFLPIAPIPVQPMFYGIEPLVKSPATLQGREKFGIPATTFVVFYSFDYLGNLERENPEGTVETFRIFYEKVEEIKRKKREINHENENSEVPSTMLVLETTDGSRNAITTQRQLNVTKMVADLPVKIIKSEDLTNEDEASLYELTDVYVSCEVLL